MKSIEVNFPTLYKLNTQGTIEQWTLQVKREPAGYPPEIILTYGEYKGKLQVKTTKVMKGKNAGKKNETSPTEQAIAEAQSKFDKKLKSGYVKSLKAAREGKVDKIIKGGINPMLAHSYEKYSHIVKLPCYVQPKLDGERCVAHYKKGKVTLWTRSRKQILSCPHIIRSLEYLLEYSDWHRHEFYLDGELYCHDLKDQFEKLMSAVRKQEPSEESLQVEFHIYDFHSLDVLEELPFKRRTEIINELPDVYCGNIFFVHTTLIHKQKEIQAAHDHYVKEGFEGLMLRNLEGDYENKRSKNLLKFKSFQDDEFEIVGVKAGKDSTVIFECVNEHGKKFKAAMNGDKKENQKYLSRDGKLKVIGKMLTVEYQGLTGKNGVPRFPQAKRIRLEK